jgi:hypothetical protein
MTISGVKNRREPSMCDWNSTPCSSMVRSPRSEKTWNPPESVRIGPSHCMNRWSPPIRARPRRRAGGEVVGVAEDHRRAHLHQIVGIERLNRREGPDRHERRCLDEPVRGRKNAGACGAGGGIDPEGKAHRPEANDSPLVFAISIFERPGPRRESPDSKSTPPSPSKNS